MPKRIEISVGDVFNRLTVEKILPSIKGHRQLKMRCVCGNSVTINVGSLKSTKSCGCLRRELAATHGYTNHPLYTVWRNMMNRCYNKNVKAYPDYGGRGITVCSEWHDPATFIDWALKKGWQKGLEIEREKNNEGYRPNNCKFVTRKINTRNRRSNVQVLISGKTMTLVEAVEKFGKVSYDTAQMRISRGWDPAIAVTTASLR